MSMEDMEKELASMEAPTITLKDENGEDLTVYVLDQTMQNGFNYLLVSEAGAEDEDECFLLKEVSVPGSDEVTYEFVDADEELAYMGRIFQELMADVDIEYPEVPGGKTEK